MSDPLEVCTTPSPVWPLFQASPQRQHIKRWLGCALEDPDVEDEALSATPTPSERTYAGFYYRAFLDGSGSEASRVCKKLWIHHEDQRKDRTVQSAIPKGKIGARGKPPGAHRRNQEASSSAIGFPLLSMTPKSTPTHQNYSHTGSDVMVTSNQEHLGEPMQCSITCNPRQTQIDQLNDGEDGNSGLDQGCNAILHGCSNSTKHPGALQGDIALPASSSKGMGALSVQLTPVVEFIRMQSSRATLPSANEHTGSFLCDAPTAPTHVTEGPQLGTFTPNQPHSIVMASIDPVEHLPSRVPQVDPPSPASSVEIPLRNVVAYRGPSIEKFTMDRGCPSIPLSERPSPTVTSSATALNITSPSSPLIPAVPHDKEEARPVVIAAVAPADGQGSTLLGVEDDRMDVDPPQEVPLGTDAVVSAMSDPELEPEEEDQTLPSPIRAQYTKRQSMSSASALGLQLDGADPPSFYPEAPIHKPEQAHNSFIFSDESLCFQPTSRPPPAQQIRKQKQGCASSRLKKQAKPAYPLAPQDINTIGCFGDVSRERIDGDVLAKKPVRRNNSGASIISRRRSLSSLMITLFLIILLYHTHL